MLTQPPPLIPQALAKTLKEQSETQARVVRSLQELKK